MYRRICIYIYTYIHIYIDRETERARVSERDSRYYDTKSFPVHAYTCTLSQCKNTHLYHGHMHI